MIKKKKQAISLILSLVMLASIVIFNANTIFADTRPIPRNAAGVPSPLGYYFIDTYYDMWPNESGGTEGITRWSMDKDGYFTITFEQTIENATFYFTNSYRGTQARFGGLIVAGGGGGGGGESGTGGAGGNGGDALIMSWAEPFWNDDQSIEYGQFYNPSHTPSGWKVNDYLYAENNKITIGHGGGGGASYAYWGTERGEGTDTGGSGYDGGSTVFCGYTVTGGKGGNFRVSNQDIHTVNWDYGKDGKVYDGNWNEIGSTRQINWFGETVYFSKGAGSGGRHSEHYDHPVQHTDWGVIDWGHDFLIYYAAGGQTYAGLGNGGGGSGVNSDWTYSKRWSETSASPVVYRTSSGGTPGKPGTAIIEGKADLVTLRVYKETDDSPANRINPMDTTVLKGIEYYVHCEEGYVDDFIIVTNNLGVAERGSLPLAHYTVTEITQTDRMQGYVCYQLGPVFSLDGIERFWKPDEYIDYADVY